MKRIEHEHHHRVFESPEQVERFYNSHKGRNRKRSELVLLRLRALGFTGGALLDAGCGFGVHSAEIARAFPLAQVTGSDLSEPIMELGRRHVTEAGVADRVKFVKDDVQKMAFPDASFDAVLSVNMFHHIERRAEMMDEIARVLKPGGILLMLDMRRNFLGYFIHPYRAAFTPAEVREIISKSRLQGWRIESGLTWWRVEAGGRAETEKIGANEVD